MKNYLAEVRNNNILKLSGGIQSYLTEKGHLVYQSGKGKITIRLTVDGKLFTVGAKEFETFDTEKAKLVEWANNPRVLEIGVGAQGIMPGVLSSKIYTWAEIDLLLSKSPPDGTPKHIEEPIPNRKNLGGLTTDKNPNAKEIPVTKDLGQTIIDTGGNVLNEIKKAAEKEALQNKLEQQAKLDEQKQPAGGSGALIIGGAVAVVIALALGIKSIK